MIAAAVDSSADAKAAAEVIRVEGVSKAFAGVTALDAVDLALLAGEVVGLLGENGAGKSTLTKILSGVHQPDRGGISLRGESVVLRSPHEALRQGIATVHQESVLAPNLTVAENLVLGQEPGFGPRRRLVRRRETLSRARVMLDQVGIDLPLQALTAELTVAQRQLVEIVRAVSEAGSLIILDEPTAALAPDEVDELFEVISRLRERSLAVLYVTHRLDEIPRICDRVVVLRDGRLAGGLSREQAGSEAIIDLMVGRRLGTIFPTRAAPGAEDVLLVRGLRTKRLAGVDLVVRRGEVVGLTGALDAGQRALARAVFGAEPSKGDVVVAGTQIPGGRPDRAVDAGVAYVSGDRGTDGVLPDLSVSRNATLVRSRALGHFGVLGGRQERRIGTELMRRFDVRAASPTQPMATLSGGNQQKALLARWAAVEPQLLILDEPTLGVDIGARKDIYEHIRQFTSRGAGVLLVSADHAELQGLSHRVLVFAAGRIVAELPAEEATEAAVVRARLRAVGPDSTQGGDL